MSEPNDPQAAHDTRADGEYLPDGRRLLPDEEQDPQYLMLRDICDTLKDIYHLLDGKL